MQEVDDKLSEIVADIQDSMRGIGEDKPVYKWVGQIKEALTLPTVKLPCNRCEGCGHIEHDTGGVSPWGEPITALQPCTCTNGEREYRIVWEWEGDAPIPEPLDIRSEGVTWNHCGADGMPSPQFTIKHRLTCIDLADRDVEQAHLNLINTCSLGILWRDILHNKGTLRLIEKEEG